LAKSSYGLSPTSHLHHKIGGKKKKKKKPKWCLLYHIIQQLFAQVSNILNPSIIEIKSISIERGGGGGG
jgi:hypothetical protein